MTRTLPEPADASENNFTLSQCNLTGLRGSSGIPEIDFFVMKLEILK